MEVYEDDNIKLWVEDDILMAVYKQPFVDEEVAIQVNEARLPFTQDKTMPSIIDFSCVREVTKPAREFLSSEKACADIKAIAIVANTYIVKIIFNFFYHINRPPYPIKLFNDTAKAKEWVKKYL